MASLFDLLSTPSFDPGTGQMQTLGGLLARAHGAALGGGDPSVIPPLLAPGQPPPMVPPQVAPPVSMAPGVQRPGLFDRVTGAMFGAAPAGLGGLLSPADQHAARMQGLLTLGAALADAGAPHVQGTGPTLLQGVMHGLEAGRQGFQGALGQALQAAQYMKQQQQAGRLDAVRQQFAANPLSPTATAEDRVNHLVQMAEAYANAGDPTTAGKLAEVAKAVREGSGGGDGQMAQFGSGVTTFVPGKGFANPDFDPKKPVGPGNLQYVPTIQRGLTQDQKAENSLNRQITEARLQNEQLQYHMTQDRMAGTQFVSENRNLINVAQTIGMARASLAELSAKNPAALSSAILAMVNVADPKAQLRSQLVNYMSTIDKSWHGSFEQLMAKIQSGTMPERQLQDMKALVERHAKTYMDMYQNRRDELLKQHPGADTWVPSADAIFSTPGLGPNAPGGAAPAAAQNAHPLDAIFGGTP